MTGLTPLTTYYVRAYATNLFGTAYGDTKAFTTAALPLPTATTEAATGIGSTGATLNGTVNANADHTTVTFEYGPTPAYGTTVTADQSPVTGSTNTAVTAAVTNLSVNTTYHYRVAAQNASGTAYGADITFTTTAVGPIPGDLDGDGDTNVADVSICLQIATGVIPGTPQQRTAADVDGDGDVDSVDARILSEYVLGIRATLP